MQKAVHEYFPNTHMSHYVLQPPVPSPPLTPCKDSFHLSYFFSFPGRTMTSHSFVPEAVDLLPGRRFRWSSTLWHLVQYIGLHSDFNSESDFCRYRLYGYEHDHCTTGWMGIQYVSIPSSKFVYHLPKKRFTSLSSMYLWYRFFSYRIKLWYIYITLFLCVHSLFSLLSYLIQKYPTELSILE